VTCKSQGGAVHTETADSANLKNWHVLYTRHQHEKTINGLLAGKGFETLLPLYTKASQWKDRKQLVHLPLFPCYVFFRAAKADWIHALKTPGVQMIVPSGSGPAVISEGEIESIRRLAEHGSMAEPHPFLKAGDRIRVKRGPFAGVEGYLIRKKNMFRLVVCVDILGQAASAEVDAAHVERIGGSTFDSSGAKLIGGPMTRQGVAL
jgi:transcription antitermination factor NusG